MRVLLYLNTFSFSSRSPFVDLHTFLFFFEEPQALNNPSKLRLSHPLQNIAPRFSSSFRLVGVKYQNQVYFFHFTSRSKDSNAADLILDV
jgi:hypothetical protein